MAIAAQTLADAGRNYVLRVIGRLAEPLELTSIELPAQRLSLDKASWAIQEKMGLLLWWGAERLPEQLLLVMESRNAVPHSPQLQPPKGWDGVLWLESFGWSRVPDLPAHFVFTLDFDR